MSGRKKHYDEPNFSTLLSLAKNRTSRISYDTFIRSPYSYLDIRGVGTLRCAALRFALLFSTAVTFDVLFVHKLYVMYVLSSYPVAHIVYIHGGKLSIIMCSHLRPYRIINRYL